MQFLNIINEILAPNKHNINFGSLNMTVQRMPNILQYVLQYALAVSYRIAIRLQPQYPPLVKTITISGKQDRANNTFSVFLNTLKSQRFIFPSYCILILYKVLNLIN